MISSRLSISAIVLSAAFIGCGGGVEPKKIPPVTPEQKAELDKQHAEMKAKTEGGTTAAPAK
jgi:hypothetical protein